MGKYVFIAEKPSVAKEFAKTLKVDGNGSKGYIESDKYIVTWCVGHLVTMSYPEAYDPALKKWNLDTLPFLPEEFKYEVIPAVKKQFDIVKGLLTRDDVERIYVCTDSGREGEYIYRLVDMLAEVPDTIDKRRVWIDSQTEEEIIRGIKEAKKLSEYDNLSAAAYLRAKEDYLMGINFSRVLTLRYGNLVQRQLKSDKWSAISVGRVMTCVLGMVVRREREIRNFVKTPFYRVLADFNINEHKFQGEFRSVEGSEYFNSPKLYKENGFKEKKDAQELIDKLTEYLKTGKAVVLKCEKKTEKKNPPMLFNLAEAQNVCSKLFKISPDETLNVIQTLYEKKLVTYPRTDARVLSTAVCKEIHKNISGLKNYEICKDLAEEVMEMGTYKTIAKTKYCDDKKITDHYAIIPTGQGLNNLRNLKPVEQKVYEVIVRRFLGIFYPPAEYKKVNVEILIDKEHFFASFKVLVKEGYLAMCTASFAKKKAVANAEKAGNEKTAEKASEGDDKDSDGNDEVMADDALIQALNTLKKGTEVDCEGFEIKEGETSPPKRYNSGSLILAMENAGQLIEDEELRSQIKSSGIGTSATRAEILSKLVKIKYLNLNKKTQIITPNILGELVYEVAFYSIKPLLDPKLTASWEKGLNGVADGSITEKEYMDKLEGYVSRRVNYVKENPNIASIKQAFNRIG
ncbi:MAG: type IA DNA topoisomerase [Lachnospiraceae bacterium]|nr:type IA DNA topoisomerase [Lachnospiraceae bacterium]